jgi:hypothetical protein
MSWTIGTLSVQHSALVGAAILDVAIQLVSDPRSTGANTLLPFGPLGCFLLQLSNKDVPKLLDFFGLCECSCSRWLTWPW